MVVGGWWMTGDTDFALGLVANRVVSLKCEGEYPGAEHYFDVEGKWLWDAINEATSNGYASIIVPERYSVAQAD